MPLHPTGLIVSLHGAVGVLQVDAGRGATQLSDVQP